MSSKNKIKTRFICQQCGGISIKWQGKCPNCNSWNSIVEEILTESEKRKTDISNLTEPLLLSEIKGDQNDIYKTNIDELNQVMGGGFIKGSVVLLGGIPGIGKSTLLLQVCQSLANIGTCLYISGEESLIQIKFRAKRLALESDKIYFVAENNFSNIQYHIEKLKPQFLIVDSIQSIYDPELQSIAGSISQVKQVTQNIINISKSSDITTLIIGQVTKDGFIAGPKVLEHAVDAVVYFEGDKIGDFRILRTIKNRFGSTNEIAIFQMTGKGLIEVKNPSQFLLEDRDNLTESHGTTIIPVLEGSRTLLIELQALVNYSYYEIPIRRCKGIDNTRLNLLLAVLQKKCKVNLSKHDVYINVIGGLKVDEPAIDLGIILAILSSMKDKSLPEDTVFLGEIGLNGEIRSVNSLEKRLIEAKKLGFKRCLLSSHNLSRNIKIPDGMKLNTIKNIKDIFDWWGEPAPNTKV